MVGLSGTSPTPLGSTLSPRTSAPKSHGSAPRLSLLKTLFARLAKKAKPEQPQVILTAHLPEMRQHILTAVADVEDHLRKANHHHR